VRLSCWGQTGVLGTDGRGDAIDKRRNTDTVGGRCVYVISWFAGSMTQDARQPPLKTLCDRRQPEPGPGSANLLHLDMRMPRTAQQVGRGRPPQDVARLAVQDIARWRLVVVTGGPDGGARGHSHGYPDIDLPADTFRNTRAAGEVDRHRQDRTGRHGRHTIRGLRRRRAGEQQQQGNHQPHAASIVAQG